MNAKRVGIVLALAMLLAASVAAVSADPQCPAAREYPLASAAIDVVVAETDMTRAGVVAAVRGGSTLAEIVENAGGDVQVVINATVAAGQERIDAALADRRITSEQATALSADLIADVTAAVNGETGPRWISERALRVFAERILLRATADETGLTSREVLREWRGGQPLAGIAVANGSSREAVLTSALAAAAERINAAMTGGRMGQAQADLLRSALPDRFSAAMDAIHTPRRVRGTI